MKQILLLIISATFLFSNDISGLSYFEYSDNQFSLSRTYLTYSNKISDDLSFKFQTDVGKVGNDNRWTAFLKKAQLNWKINNDVNVSMGLIGMNMFNIQEKNWGNRFLFKSAMDANKYSASADLGFSVGYDFGPISANLMMSNGEGYKNSVVDENTKISLQLVHGEKRLDKNDGYNLGMVYSTLTIDEVAAIEDSYIIVDVITGGLCEDGNLLDQQSCEAANTCGANLDTTCLWTPTNGSDIADWSQQVEVTGTDFTGEKTESVVGIFGGWSANNMRIGAEFNTQTISEVGSEKLNNSLSSIYLNHKLQDQLSIFIRMDSVTSENIEEGDVVEDKNDINMFGVIWNPTKGLTICPNIIQDDGGDNVAVNFQFKF